MAAPLPEDAGRAASRAAVEESRAELGRVEGELTIPTNVSPEYKKAEAAFKRAREPREQLELLREMMRTIPKHKGTEHVQAGIKTKIKELTEALAGPGTGGTRTGPATTVRPVGAGQIVLLGPPNSGKSTLHGALTGSHSPAGPYPFTTQYPQPGMLSVADVAIQLVDLPPISSQHPVPWIANAVQSADGCLLVVDVSSPGCIERVVGVVEALSARNISMVNAWPHGPDGPVDEDDPFAIILPTLIVVTKIVSAIGEEIEVLTELADLDLPWLAVDAAKEVGLDELGLWLFDALGVVRVYTKIPGKPADHGKPYTVRRGQTVADVAVLVHKDFDSGLKFAKLWGASGPGARQVGRDYVVEDGDLLELHA